MMLRALYAVIGIFWGTEIDACDFCTPVVFLDNARAACFLEIYVDRLDKLNSGGRGFVEVNLDSCTKPQSARTKSVVSGPREPEFDGGAKIYLDTAGMKCVRKLILANAGAFDPQKTLLLVDDCRPETGATE